MSIYKDEDFSSLSLFTCRLNQLTILNHITDLEEDNKLIPI